MPQKMAMVDYKKCRPAHCDNGICMAALSCPHKLLEQEAPYEAPMPNTSLCQSCGKCVVACPLKAVRLN